MSKDKENLIEIIEKWTEEGVEKTITSVIKTTIDNKNKVLEEEVKKFIIEYNNINSNWKVFTPVHVQKFLDNIEKVYENMKEASVPLDKLFKKVEHYRSSVNILKEELEKEDKKTEKFSLLDKATTKLKSIKYIWKYFWEITDISIFRDIMTEILEWGATELQELSIKYLNNLQNELGILDKSKDVLEKYKQELILQLEQAKKYLELNTIYDDNLNIIISELEEEVSRLDDKIKENENKKKINLIQKIEYLKNTNKIIPKIIEFALTYKQSEQTNKAENSSTKLFELWNKIEELSNNMSLGAIQKLTKWIENRKKVTAWQQKRRLEYKKQMTEELWKLDWVIWNNLELAQLLEKK